MILHKSRILWWSRRVRFGPFLFLNFVNWNPVQRGSNSRIFFTHLPMLDQDYLDGFHRLANSSAQTEAPSSAGQLSKFRRKISIKFGAGVYPFGSTCPKTLHSVKLWSCVCFFLWSKVKTSKTCFDAVGMFVMLQRWGSFFGVTCCFAFDVRPTHFKHFPSQTWDKSSKDPQTTWKKKAVWPVLLHVFTRQSLPERNMLQWIFAGRCVVSSCF